MHFLPSPHRPRASRLTTGKHHHSISIPRGWSRTHDTRRRRRYWSHYTDGFLISSHASCQATPRQACLCHLNARWRACMHLELCRLSRVLYPKTWIWMGYWDERPPTSYQNPLYSAEQDRGEMLVLNAERILWWLCIKCLVCVWCALESAPRVTHKRREWLGCDVHCKWHCFGIEPFRCHTKFVCVWQCVCVAPNLISNSPYQATHEIRMYKHI